MKQLLLFLFAFTLIMGCKAVETEPNLMYAIHTAGIEMDTLPAKGSLVQRIFSKKPKQVQAFPKKCKNCYIINVQADNGATVTAPVKQGDTDTKNKNGSLVAPQTQNTAPHGSIQADQENTATAPPAKSKLPFVLLILALLVGAALVGRFILKNLYG